jgi:uncharacterized protein
MSTLSQFWKWLIKRRVPPADAVREPAMPTAPTRPKSITAAMWGELAGLLKVSKRSRSAERPKTSLKLPRPYPGVLPAGAPTLAQDGQISAVYNFGEQAGGWEGYGFMGYAMLAELAQIPEFRKPSEILANEMTRKWVKLISTSDSDKTEKLKDLEDEFERLGVQEAFRQAFEGDNFFGRMQIFPVIKGFEGDLLKTPLDIKANVERDSLVALRVIEPIWTYPNDYNSVDPTAANFYKPQSWFVLSQQIHASRMLTVVSRPVPDILKPAYLFGGVSLTQLLHPYVENWRRTRQSVSNITHNFSTPVLKTDLGKLTEPGGAQLLFNRIDVFNNARDNQGAMVVDNEKEDFVNVSAPLSGLDKLQAQAQEQMAAIAGIPLVKLFGITPSGLNASSDGEIRSLYDTIESTQERIGTPHLRRLLDLIQMSKFGMIDSDIGFVWEPLWSLDEKGLAEVRKINAETDCAYADHGILDPLEIRLTVAAEENSRYASINVDELPVAPEQEGERDDEDDNGDAPEVRDAPDARLRDSSETTGGARDERIRANV